MSPAWPPFETQGHHKLSEPPMRVGDMKAAKSGSSGTALAVHYQPKAANKGGRPEAAIWNAQKAPYKERCAVILCLNKLPDNARNWLLLHLTQGDPVVTHKIHCLDPQQVENIPHNIHSSYTMKRLTIINTLDHSQSEKQQKEKKINLLEMFYSVFSLSVLLLR